MIEAPGGAAPDQPSSETLRLRAVLAGIDRTEVRRQRGIVFCLSGLAASIALKVLAAVANSGPACFVSFGGDLLLLSGLCFLALAALRLIPSFMRADVAVEADALVLRRENGVATRRIPFAEITQGHWEDPDRLILGLRSREILVVRTRDEAAASRVLALAHLTPGERVLRAGLPTAASMFPFGSALASGGLAILFPTLLALTLALGGSIQKFLHHPRHPGEVALALALVASGVGAGFALLRLLRRRELVVGTDGVVFRKAFGETRLRHADIRSVSKHPRGLQLELTEGGARVFIPTIAALQGNLRYESAVPTLEETGRDALVERIEGTRRAERGAGIPEASLDRLDRRGRSIPEWREDLRELARPGAGYRHTAMGPSDLGALIEDASAPAERRIAAAVILGTNDRDEARTRVRIAASATADDDLRAALEQAAEGEIAEEALRRRVL